MNSISNMWKKTGIREVLGLTFLVRLVFKLFLAKYYYGREDFFMDYDTLCWAQSFENLLKIGEFTADPNLPSGYFYKMPLFSFYLGGFYLLAGKDWTLAYQMVSWFQILVDCAAVWLVYKTVIRATASESKALLSSLLFALYPFYLVWSPIAYTECLSVFFLVLCLYFCTAPNTPRASLVYAGIALACAALLRPQLLILAALIPGTYFLTVHGQVRNTFRFSLWFGLGFLLGFGPWPARNYIFHHRILITQDISGSPNYDVDVMAFTKFMYAVQTDWNPQFDEIVAGKPVTYPEGLKFDAADSTQLARAFELARTKSYGFSYWRGSWRAPVQVKPPETDTLVAIFTALRTKQIQEHPVDFWFWVPLGNLKKALFKTSLKSQSNQSLGRQLASKLFYLRSLLLFAGLFSALLLLLRKRREGKFLLLLSLVYFTLFYLLMCFGNTSMLRNIEMRYFLHADLLMLLPLAFYLSERYEMFRSRVPLKG